MAQPDYQPEHLTVAEVAQLVHVSAKTVTRQIKAGRLEAVKIGSRWRIPVAAYRAWSQAHPTEDS